jgi:hypothetical protein
LAAAFVASTNLSFHQAASSVMHKFVVELIQLGASLPREAIDRIVDVPPLVDEINDHAVAEAIWRNPDETFQTRMAHLSELHFVHRVFDACTVNQMKTIRCLITNLFSHDPPVLLTLRENINFTA